MKVCHKTISLISASKALTQPSAQSWAAGNFLLSEELFVSLCVMRDSKYHCNKIAFICIPTEFDE